MIALIADTHAEIWNLTDESELSVLARRSMDDAIIAGQQIGLASISLVEMAYLNERARIPQDTFALFIQAIGNPDFGLTLIPFDREVASPSASSRGPKSRTCLTASSRRRR